MNETPDASHAAGIPESEAPPDVTGGASPDADIAGLGYEAARDELVGIVARLESNAVPLADALGLWRRGEALAAHCTRWLDRATSEVEAHLTARE